MIHGFITIRIIGPDDAADTDFTFDISEIPENPELWQAIYDAGFECRNAIYNAARVPTIRKTCDEQHR